MPITRDDDRTLDLESLKALAHPLRVRIVDAMAVHGQFTASGLAERLGESSGSMSYHLRQLEKHGFVREVEGKGTARERWWERTPGGLTLRADRLEKGPAADEASTLVMRQWEHAKSSRLIAFTEKASQMSPEWMDASTLMTANLKATHAQLNELVEAFSEHILPLIDRLRAEPSAEARPVQIHFNAFPVLDDGDPLP